MELNLLTHAVELELLVEEFITGVRMLQEVCLVEVVRDELNRPLLLKNNLAYDILLAVDVDIVVRGHVEVNIRGFDSNSRDATRTNVVPQMLARTDSIRIQANIDIDWSRTLKCDQYVVHAIKHVLGFGSEPFRNGELQLLVGIEPWVVVAQEALPLHGETVGGLARLLNGHLDEVPAAVALRGRDLDVLGFALEHLLQILRILRVIGDSGVDILVVVCLPNSLDQDGTVTLRHAQSDFEVSVLPVIQLEYLAVCAVLPLS